MHLLNHKKRRLGSFQVCLQQYVATEKTEANSCQIFTVTGWLGNRYKSQLENSDYVFTFFFLTKKGCELSIPRDAHTR